MEITRTIWQKVNLPTIALGLLWIVHSLATTAYVPWQNNRQRTALSANLAAIDEVLQIRECLSQLQAIEAPGEAESNRQAALGLCDEVLRSLAMAGREVRDDESQALLSELTGSVEQFKQVIARQPEGAQTVVAADAARLIHRAAASSSRLVKRREQLLLNSVEERSQTDVVVMIVRAILLVMGLAIGIGLAWWTAIGINRTLSQIVVSLKGIEGELPVEIGRIDVVPAGASDHDLNSLHKHVQHVVEAIRHVAEELKQARGEIVRAERLAAVGELAAGVAHEIRNPLTSVKLIVQRAAERRPVHSLNEQQLTVLLEEVSRIETTVQGLLDFAHPARPQRLSCDLGELVRRTVSLVAGRAEQGRVEICAKFEDSDTPVAAEVDPALIQQVLVNLLINALDSMHAGGRLEVALRAKADEVVLQVRDSGGGIAPIVFERMFEPFVTTKAGGTGLGLAISRRIVQEHGGTLTAANVAGGGAMFTVRLPARNGGMPAVRNGSVASGFELAQPAPSGRAS